MGTYVNAYVERKDSCGKWNTVDTDIDLGQSRVMMSWLGVGTKVKVAPNLETGISSNMCSFKDSGMPPDSPLADDDYYLDTEYGWMFVSLKDLISILDECKNKTYIANMFIYSECVEYKAKSLWELNAQMNPIRMYYTTEEYYNKCLTGEDMVLFIGDGSKHITVNKATCKDYRFSIYCRRELPLINGLQEIVDLVDKLKREYPNTIENIRILFSFS